MTDLVIDFITGLLTGLKAPKAPLFFKPDWFFKLTDFFFCDPKPKGVVQQVLETGCKPVLVTID